MKPAGFRSSDSSSPRDGPHDPVWVSSRREALVILSAWATFGAWTVGLCWLVGYGDSSEPVAIVLGMPAWVVWGVMAPWVAATAFSLWFSLYVMTDEQLDGPADVTAGESAAHQETADD